MLNSGPTRAACGNMAMASAIDSSAFLPGYSSRAMAYAANIATITDSSVAMIAMPNELRSALVNSSSLNTVLKLDHDHCCGKKVGVPSRKVSGSLNDSDTIHSSGKAAQMR